MRATGISRDRPGRGRRLRRIALVVGVLTPAAVAAQDVPPLRIDPAASQITVRVGKAGVFSFAGHDHEVVAPAIQGSVSLDASDPTRSNVTIQFDAGALRVTGRGEPPADVPEVQRIMLSERVLDVQQYPTIAFESRSVSLVRRTGDRIDLRVAGDLTLHGVTRPITLPVVVRLTSDGLDATGSVSVRQSEFGIRPVTAAGGTVRVKDEVTVSFTVVARRE